MPDLNILVGIIYTVLIIIEFLVIKHLFRTKSEEMYELVREQEGNSLKKVAQQTNSQENGLNFAMLLKYFMSLHPFSKCCNQYFPYRSYELLVFCVIVNILICGESLEKLVYSIPLITGVDFVLLSAAFVVKHISKTLLAKTLKENVKQKANFTMQATLQHKEDVNHHPIMNRFNFRVFIYEICYTIVSAASLVALGSKYFQIVHRSFQSIHGVELLAISISAELLIFRPINLLIIGLFTTVLCKLQRFEQLRKDLIIAVTTNHQQVYAHKQNIKKRLELVQMKSCLANQRGSQLRIQDLNQQQTQQHINTYQPTLQQQYRPNQTQQTHPSPLRNMILITNTQQTHQSSRSQQQQRISPVKVNSPNSYNFNSKTIKKEMPTRRNQTANEAINEIQEFQITCDSKEVYEVQDVVSDNYRTRKGEGLETAIGTSTETALEGIKKKESERVIRPLQQLEFSNLPNANPLTVKTIYNPKRADRIIGNIIDDQTIKADDIGEKEGCTTQPPRKKKSRNKKIHVIYTQQSSDNDRRESRSHSAGTNSRNSNHDILIGDEKENKPDCSLTNRNSNYYFPSKSLQMPGLNPIDLLLIRTNKDQEPDDQTEDAYERRKRKRRSRKIDQQITREKSPYLEFLPKMLRKEQIERNQSCIVEPRQKLPHCKPSANPSRNSKKPGMQLQIIKKTISSEIDTVYT